MMRAQAIAVVARVNNNRVITQAQSFQATKNRADALINQRHQAEVPLLDAPIFFGRNPEKQLSGQAVPVKNRFRLLPFSHKPVAERNIFALGKRGGKIEVNFFERVTVVERTVVRRVWFYRRNNE